MSALATGRGGGSASAAAPCRSPPSRGLPPRPLRTRRVGAVRAAPPARGDQPAAEGGGEGPGQPTGVRRRELLGASLASLAALQGGRAPVRAWDAPSPLGNQPTSRPERRARQGDGRYIPTYLCLCLRVSVSVRPCVRACVRLRVSVRALPGWSGTPAHPAPTGAATPGHGRGRFIQSASVLAIT